MDPCPPHPVFEALKSLVEEGGSVAHVVHEHKPTRTMQDAAQNLRFDVTRIVKTVAFRTRDGRLVLAALPGILRVDYARLSALVGVGRRDLSALSPQEVLDWLGVEPGSVSPLALALPEVLPRAKGALLLMDDEVLTIVPTLYCGMGRPDRTLELAAEDLLRLSGGRLAGFSRGVI